MTFWNKPLRMTLNETEYPRQTHDAHVWRQCLPKKHVDILRCCYAICSNVDGTLFKCHYTVYLASMWPLVGHCCLWTDKWALSHFWPFMGSLWKQVVGCNLFWKSVPNDDFGAEMWCMKFFNNDKHWWIKQEASHEFCAIEWLLTEVHCMHCIESFIFKWHIFSGSYRPHWDCKGLHRPKKLLSCTENLLWKDLSVCEDTFFRKTSNEQPVWPWGMVKSTSLCADDFFWNLAWVAQKLKVKQEMLRDHWTCFSCLFFPWWIKQKDIYLRCFSHHFTWKSNCWCSFPVTQLNFNCRSNERRIQIIIIKTRRSSFNCCLRVCGSGEVATNPFTLHPS